MTQAQFIIAIDIGKATLQVHTTDHALSVPNDSSGWRKIIAIAKAQEHRSLVVCEASGGYECALLDALHHAGVSFRRVNPARVRGFALSEGVKAKTDPIDAGIIHRFAAQKELQPSSPPPPHLQRLSELLDRRHQLASLIAREKNHLELACKQTAASCNRLLRTLERELLRFEELIRELIAREPALLAQARVLTSVSGVGEVTAWSILAYLHEITSLSRNQLVALAGLAPYNRDSGAFAGKRRIFGGRAKVRRCLYMAAHTAATHNPVIKPYVHRLRERGKPYKCAIVAAMRKLLLHLQSLLRKSSPFPLAA
jgi:transposase